MYVFYYLEVPSASWLQELEVDMGSIWDYRVPHTVITQVVRRRDPKLTGSVYASPLPLSNSDKVISQEFYFFIRYVLSANSAPPLRIGVLTA